MDLAVVELGRSMASLHLSSNQHSIDEDLWAEILKRLPSKTLVRFLCVCKSWKSLLSCSFFHAHHLKFSEINSYFRVRTPRGNNGLASYTLHHRDNTTTKCLDFPVRPHRLLNLIGVLDGVVCLAYVNQVPLVWSPDSVYLWNPSIRKYIDIPWPFVLGFIKFCNFAGLGFDTSKNSFKVVLSPPFEDGDGYYYVFSVCEGVWRRKPLPDYVRSHKNYGVHGCFMNGSIHWITYPMEGRMTKYFLLLFDCEHEEFRTMDLPEQGDMFHQDHKILVHDGLLQVFISKGHYPYTYELWKMNKYGDATSWTKHQTVSWDEFRGEVLPRYFVPKDESDDLHQLHIVPKLIGTCAVAYKESMLLIDIGKPSGR